VQYPVAIVIVIFGLLGQSLVLRFLAGGRLPATAGVILLTAGSEIMGYGGYHSPRMTGGHSIPANLVALGALIMLVGPCFVTWGSIKAGASRRAR
jgi:hypothetical protein